MYGTAYFLTKFLTKANNLITLNVFVNVKQYTRHVSGKVASSKHMSACLKIFYMSTSGLMQLITKAIKELKVLQLHYNDRYQL